MNAPPITRRRSSHPQGREAIMMDTTTVHSDPSWSDASWSDASSPVAGIDVAKDKLDVFIDSATSSSPPPPQQQQRFSLANSAEQIARLIERLRQAGVRLVVLESTGRYHRRVAGTLLEAGINTCLANPQRVRQFARASGRLEKSDAIDSQVLAEFARGIKQLNVLQKQPENQAILRDLVSRRRGLVQMRIAEKNRAHDELPKLARRQSNQLLRMLEQQIEDLDRAIAKLIEDDDEAGRKSRILDSVPGIAADSANQLVVELPELGKLNRQQIAKLVGVAPLVQSSGKFKGTRRIFGGRGNVRSLLYMLAHNAALYCERFKQYLQQLLARGKKHKQAMTACMRKLLVTLNQMVKTNTHWHQNLATPEA
jgi:transposase